MENPFETKTKQKGEFALVRLHKSVIEQLELLGKGTPNRAISFLLSKDNPDNLKEQIKTMQQDITAIQNNLEILIRANHLRTY